MESKWVKDQVSDQLDKETVGAVKRYQVIEVGGHARTSARNMHGEIRREGPSFSFWYQFEEYCREEEITDDNGDEIKLVDVVIMNESEYPGICDGYEEYMGEVKYKGFTKKEFVSAVIGINEGVEVLEVAVEA